MIVYHGSHEIIEIPASDLGSPGKDFGKGFYCTENSDLAKEWACPTANDGFSNKYDLDLTDLNILHLNSAEYNILNWIAILLKNRIFSMRAPISREASKYIISEFLPDVSGYDVICGYRADDSYFSYTKAFLNNSISVSQLVYALKIGNLGEQIILTSKRAFEKIQFIGYEKAYGAIYNSSRMERDAEARHAFLDTDFKISAKDLYVLDILREQVKNDDKRLR